MRGIGSGPDGKASHSRGKPVGTGTKEDKFLWDFLVWLMTAWEQIGLPPL